MKNIITTKNIEKVTNMEIRFSDILFAAVRNVAEKIMSKGQKWEIQNSQLHPTPLCQEYMTDIFIDEEGELRVTLNTNRTMELYNLTHTDICQLLKTKNNIIRNADVDKLKKMGDKLRLILLTLIQTQIMEASPFSMIVEIHSRKAAEPLCGNFYEASFQEIKSIYISQNKIMGCLYNDEEIPLESLTCGDLCEIVKELA